MNDVVDARAQFTGVARLALHAWDVPDTANLRLLKHRENAVFAVDIDAKPASVLRVHRRGYHSDAALRSELSWMSALNDEGIPTPRVRLTARGDSITHVAARDGGAPHQCDLLSWVPGVPLGSIENRSFGKEDFIAHAYEQVGRLAAQVHLHSENCRPIIPIERHSWDEEGCLGPQAVWGYFGALATLKDQERALLERASTVARRRLAEFGRAPSRFGLIHGDLIPENVLIDGETCTLIDFDDAGFGWYVGEIATAVFFQVGTPSFAPALRAIVRGYRQVRAITPEELRMLDVLLFLRGMAVLGWLNTRSETETAHQINPSVTEIVLGLGATLTGDETYATRLKIQFEPLAI